MLEFSIILIILLTLSLCVTFKYLDDMVLDFKKKLEAVSFDIIASICAIRKDLETFNCALKNIHKLQTTKFFDYSSRILDALGLVLLFMPAKNKKMFFRKLLSISFISKFINVIRAF